MVEPYDRACALVTEHQRASTSWLQRQMRIGYNEAARYIERMQAEGYVSAPDHVGRRAVLRPPSAAMPGSSAIITPAEPEVHPWERNAGKYDKPSSALPPRPEGPKRSAGKKGDLKAAEPDVGPSREGLPVAETALVPTVAPEEIEALATQLVEAVGLEGARRTVRAAAERGGSLLPPRVKKPRAEHLTLIVERIEGLIGERTAINDEIRNAFGFAKDIGLMPGALRECIKARAMNKDRRFEHEAVVTIYRAALGIEDPDFVIELPPPAAPPPPKARRISAREKQYRQALALTSAAHAIIDM